ncbi:MAG: hypothetical protein NTY53_17750, partial [Kiritimatiellaeota bacterium]|nr:hypothetical protein [Kiritimatiellota bacterium]
MDCKEDQAWDVCLSLTMNHGRWVVKQTPLGGSGNTTKPIASAAGVLGTVAEVSLDIREFVPLTMAKPVWTLMLEVKGKGPKGKAQWLRSKELSVFNEDAKEGVAAGPYVRTFLCMCADKPVDDFGLTAAAIAIMSVTMYENSDEEVRRKLRADNAEFLELAHSIDVWQSQSGAEYRLRKYPLEAQLAWAARIWHNFGHLETSREPGAKNNRENYYWVSTSVDTYRKLQTTAIREGLTNASL